MFRARVLNGVLAGCLAAAATAGGLVGLGFRRAGALAAFVEAGRSVLPAPDGLVPLTWLALTSGLALHVVWMILWGVVFALIAGRWSRVWVAIGAAAFVTILAFVTERGPYLLGVLGSAPLTAVQRALLLALMAAALFAGVRVGRVSR